jgi:hypothetical protein
MKLINNSKNSSSNPLQRLYSCDFNHENAYRNLPVVLKIHTESRQGLVNLRRFFPAIIDGGHWRKSTNDREGSWDRNNVRVLYNGKQNL